MGEPNKNDDNPMIEILDGFEKNTLGCLNTIIVLIVVAAVFSIFFAIDGCSNNNDSIYPNFNSSHYIEIAQKKIKSKLNYPSTAKFSYWEANPYEENGGLYVMASGKVEAKNAFGLELAYICYVKFKVDLETNTYQVYEPIISDW